MCVCSRLTRAGSTPAPACAANASANAAFQPRSSRATGVTVGPTVTRLAGPPPVRRIPHRCPALLALQLQPAAQYFRDAPRLRDTAARHIRRFGVEDLGDLPDARVVEVAVERRQLIAQVLPVGAR